MKLDGTLMAYIISGLTVLVGALFSLLYLAVKKYVEKLSELSAEDFYKGKK